MIAFLTSSPCVYGADRAILNPENHFLDNLFAVLPEHPACLFVASSPDSPDQTDHFAEEMAEAFREAGMEFGDFAVLDRRNQEDARLLVWESDFVILAGGHVPTQNVFFQEIGLREILENYQGVLMGISAGSMNAADRVYIQPEEEGESDPNFPRFAQGLGLTNVNILPHYQQVKDYILDGKRLFEDITFADSMGECFLVLVDGSYVLADGTQQLLFGEAYTIRDGVMEQIAGPGDVTVLGREV